MSNQSRLLITSAFCLMAAATASAAPLTEAQVTKIINDVRVIDPARGSHPAALQETIKDELALKTGVKSRSELRFQDQTLTRLGPETSFSFKSGTRDMSLEQGTMLLHVPKGLGGARIRTAAVTAAITGTTIMIEYHPKQSLKVLVLEGSLRLSVNGRFGDSLLLTPGRMVIMPPNAKRIPEPVTVDLAKIVKTSALVQMDKSESAPLPSMALIENEIATQAQEKGGRTLIDTNLLIAGSGTNVMMEPDAVLSALDKKSVVRNQSVLLTGSATPPPVPTATPDHNPTPPPTATPQSSATPGASPTPAATPES
ncbi:MAG TPA: FecR family protein, partial [Chthoniobacterales bacterium]|nr:FecR family protein [Chthoniobacterales bacterium]